MQKFDSSDPASRSLDLVRENIAKLKELFPEIVTEGKINFGILQSILGNEIEECEEFYRFTWAGKSEARREAHKPGTGTLRPAPGESLNWDTTQNLYLEGDNLEVLKLLQKSYAGKVKMIYIDPPYNTGKDFVYKDNYSDNLKNYQELTGQVDDAGNKLSTNSDSDGRYHSNWLNMMYPRLRLARNLLKDDGVIFVSIGVEEFSNLTAMLKEVFGEENFIELFSWVKTATAPALSTKSRKTNEYIVCFERNRNFIKYNGGALDGGDQPLLNSGNSIRQLIFPKECVYFKEDKFQDGLVKSGIYDRVRLSNDIQIVSGYSQTDIVLEGEFKWTQDFLNKEISNGTHFIIKSEKLSVRFTRNEEGFKRPSNFIKQRILTPLINKTENGVGTNESASKELITLLNGNYFDHPKPVQLIHYLSKFICTGDDLILDFFSGSATTAHAVMQLNAEDGGNRKFIQVQLPEPTPEKSEARNAGYTNIAEIGKERIRRAAKKIAAENPEKAKALDLGFKVFKLDSSNIKTWDGNPDELISNLFDSVSNIKKDRSEEDVLYEILLKYGLDITLPISEKILDGKRVFLSQADNSDALFLCLADGISSKTAEAIGQWKEELQLVTCRVLFKDSGFTDVEKTNAMQTLKRFGITEIKSI